jgi:hypothetical protein
MERIITEGIDLTTRKIVRDIIKIVRSGEVGSWELPSDLDGDDYYDKEVKVYFDWNKNWKEEGQKYFVDGNYDDETETIQVVLFVNNDYYPELLYDLIADLNDIIAHEYEHHYQNIELRPENEYSTTDYEDQPKDYTYYLQSHEIPALIRGLRRVMKLRKISFEDALNQWYGRTFDEKDMSKNDFEKLKDSLKKEYEKRHGKE